MLLRQKGFVAILHALSHTVQLLGIWAATGIPLVVVDPILLFGLRGTAKYNAYALSELCIIPSICTGLSFSAREQEKKIKKHNFVAVAGVM